METTAGIKITRKKLVALFNDNIKSAEAIDLVYVTDNEPGITRTGDSKSFTYLLRGKPVTDAATLSRIKSLVLPPAWQQVWICAYPNGHLQATGLDARNRKQYKYHPLWNAIRNQTKFYHLCDFGKALPRIRQQVEKDLGKPGLPLEKVLAAIVSIMASTSIRIGNSQYEKLYGSFGLTTLKNKHVSIDKTNLQFTFRGKKGIHQDISLKSRKLANIVKQCKEIPGKELFQYLDDSGHRHCIDSGMVNSYIRDISGGKFTAKDFRTWSGTLHAIAAFKEMGYGETETETKKNIVSALDLVATHLGNTRTVCRKYYVHHVVIDHYTNKTIAKYFPAPGSKLNEDAHGLSADEQIMMQLLECRNVTVIAA